MSLLRLRKSERLMDRIALELELDMPVGSKFKRLYPGHWQRSAGAWLWMIVRPGRGDIGSIYTVTELLKEKTLDTYVHHGDTEICGKEEGR